jgi:very-short-patch-repair endonuclease
LEALGARVMRFTNTEVMQNFENVCAMINKAICAEP